MPGAEATEAATGDSTRRAENEEASANSGKETAAKAARVAQDSQTRAAGIEGQPIESTYPEKTGASLRIGRGSAAAEAICAPNWNHRF
jgi:hypothetical protein